MTRDLPTGVYRSGLSHYQYRLRLPPDALGKRRPEVRGGFLTPEDAAMARTRRLVELGLARPSELHADRQTLGDWLDAYLAAHALQVDGVTLLNYRSIRTHLEPLEHVELRDLTSGRIRAWVTQLARDKTPGTARRALRLLVQSLHQAVRPEVLPRNAAAVVRGPRHEPRQPAVLTPEQIGRLLRAADASETPALWYCAVLLQLRTGELGGLRWDDVDFALGILHVRRTRTRNAAGRYVLGEGTKTASSVRAIEMPAECIDRLKAHRAAQNRVRLSAPPGTWTDLGLVFPNDHGGVAHPSRMAYQLTRLCRDAGVPEVSPHGLRHAGITLLRSLGVPPEVVQRRAGHSALSMTAHYSHAIPGEQRAASDALSQALRRIV